jgi:hypothetical protein
MRHRTGATVTFTACHNLARLVSLAGSLHPVHKALLELASFNHPDRDGKFFFLPREDCKSEDIFTSFHNHYYD